MLSGAFRCLWWEKKFYVLSDPLLFQFMPSVSFCHHTPLGRLWLSPIGTSRLLFVPLPKLPPLQAEPSPAPSASPHGTNAPPRPPWWPLLDMLNFFCFDGRIACALLFTDEVTWCLCLSLILTRSLCLL